TRGKRGERGGGSQKSYKGEKICVKSHGAQSGLAVVAKFTEHIVVAGGGVIGEDDRQRVGAREPARREVEAAALAQAGAAAVPRGAAVGPVEDDGTTQECEA